VKAGQTLFRKSLTADALVPRDTSRREHPTSTPYGLKRVAGAIGKQISALKATVAKLKKMRLPMRRLSIFSTKEATSSQTDRPLLAGQSKTTNLKGPLLPASLFRSPEEDTQPEEDPFKVMETPLSGREAQVKQIFSMGSGPISENDVVRHGEVPPPNATPEVGLPSILEL
jgi:hypothetical protein